MMSRRAKYLLPICSLLAFAFVSLIAMRAFAQTGIAQNRITQPVNETKLAVLQGNVHPLARAQFDRGAAPASLAMDHMLLVLKRSPQQEAALEVLLAQQQDRSSPNYHKWLTPEQFGQQFGPSDQDIQKISTWLESHGFQINEVSKGRTTIDFSGNAGQVQQAFHAAIHRYVLPDGTQHWANASNPEIPAALVPVVAGVNSLNDFSKKPMSHTLGVFQRSKATGKITRVNPQFTYAGGCNDNPNAGVTGTNCFAVGPADFAKIYNVPSTVTGAGQTIAIVSDTDINESDVTNFRSFFGLPPVNFQQIETGTDPGVVANGDEGEAVLDVEWSGGVAPGANIDLVVSPSTTSTFGGDTSAQYIINCQTTGSGCPTAVPASILSYSYGECELFLGTSGNAFYQNLWSQAAGEGITVLVSTGDSGSAGCDAYSSTNTSPVQPAFDGLAVNGIASTPFNIAVGGTDFNDFNSPSQTNIYWNSTNALPSQASAKGYIPEIAYNDSCTNSLIYTAFSDTSAEQGCNDPSVQSVTSPPLVTTFGGSGGVSDCTINSTISSTQNPDPSTCSGGYAKPSWQTGPGVPNDNKRDIPDVSLFSGDGTIQNFYVVCQSDQIASAGNAACSLTGPSTSFLGAGGTSVATQAFAGVMALVDQQQGRQGNPNPELYALGAAQAASSCNATGSTPPASTCVFNDVTTGTIAMPCQKGSFNCTTLTQGDTVGVLTGFDAGTGYDLATGLGSLNVGNLLGNWKPSFYLSASNPSVTIASAGGSGTLDVTAYAVGGFTGTVNLACSGLPAGASCSSNPSSPITPTSTGTPITLTVSTGAASMMAPGDIYSRRSPPITIGEIIAALGLFLAMLLAGWRDKQLRWSAALALVTLVLLAAGMEACGGGYGSGNPGGGGVPAPLVNLSPKSLTFSSQNVGTYSKTQTVTLTDIGTASMSIARISASGDFSESNNCGTTLGTAANCPIQVSFSPTATGTRSGTLTIQDSAAGSPHTVPLSGTAVSSGGAGNGGTPSGTSIVTLTGTASGGSPTFSMNFTLTVQ
ncbi:MAG TPA: protease pro-enzyme activation domain-containing protein [Candidatus Acidoferrales bacterium]|nr:protease pro-enzyme activation domain-containing protein [Candidatus Acidoferrales bacterium]